MSETVLITCADLPQHFAKKMKKPLSFQQEKGFSRVKMRKCSLSFVVFIKEERKGGISAEKKISQQLPAYGVRLSEGRSVPVSRNWLRRAGPLWKRAGRNRVTRAGEQRLRESGLL